MGLAYWSNRINSWEEFPSTEGTINASLAGEFSIFQRKLVTDFLAWQASIVNEYKQDKQFVTHNFDFDWRGYSFGIQPDVDQFAVSKAVDIAGCDIYHPSQEALAGAEIDVPVKNVRLQCILLYNLTIRQKEEETRQSVEKLKRLACKYSGQLKIVVLYARSLVNLIVFQNEKDAQQSVAELKRLVDKHLDHQKINEQYAMGFVNLYNKQKEEDFPI